MRLRSWKHALAVTALACIGIAGGRLIRAFADSPHQEHAYWRVESITLDPHACKLYWTVTRGDLQNGQFAPAGKKESYEISFHRAEMTHNGVARQFSLQEAYSVHQVMLALSRYAAASVEWFEEQQTPVERAAR